MTYICSTYNNHNAQLESQVKLQMKTHIDKYKAYQLDDEMSKGIIINCEEQLTLALEKYKYFQKWGNHQYRQLLRALNQQSKNNFRDKAVASFGGQLFDDQADIADDTYNNLPPPKASLIAQKPQA